MLTHYLLYLFHFLLGFIWNASVFPDRVTMEDNSTTISVIGNSSEKVVSCDVFIEQNHSQFDFTNGMFDGILYNLIINIFVSAVGFFLSVDAISHSCFQEKTIKQVRYISVWFVLRICLTTYLCLSVIFFIVVHKRITTATNSLPFKRLACKLED